MLDFKFLCILKHGNQFDRLVTTLKLEIGAIRKRSSLIMAIKLRESKPTPTLDMPPLCTHYLSQMMMLKSVFK